MTLEEVISQFLARRHHFSNRITQCFSKALLRVNEMRQKCTMAFLMAPSGERTPGDQLILHRLWAMGLGLEGEPCSHACLVMFSD